MHQYGMHLVQIYANFHIADVFMCENLHLFELTIIPYAAVKDVRLVCLH